MRISVEEIKKVASLHCKMRGLTKKDALNYVFTQEKDEYYYARKELIDYLNGLEYEKILELEVLMDFGREWYYHVEPEYDDDDEMPTEPFYVDIMSCFGNFQQFVGNPEGKDMAILYLIGKAPLAQYLRSALQHCNPDTLTLPV